MSHNPTAKITLPTGSLGVVFKRGSPAIVKSVSPNSSVLGRIKPGYIFVALYLADGSVYTDLDATQLVTTLSEHSHEEGRKIKFSLGLPNEMEAPIDPGPHGATIKEVNGFPVITKLATGSSLRRSCRPGMIIKKVELGDGTRFTAHSAKEIEQILEDDIHTEGRILHLVGSADHDNWTKKLKLPDEKEVEIPAGKLGVTFKGGRKPAISKLAKDSSCRGKFRVGMVVHKLTLADETMYKGLDPTSLAGFLRNSADQTGRTLTLKNKDALFPKQPTTKAALPSLGGAEDLGLTFQGTPAILKRIEKTSPLYGKVHLGQVVHAVGSESNEYTGLDDEDMIDVLGDTSGEEERFIVFLNKRKAVVADIVECDLPSGTLGVAFKGTPPTVTKIYPDSPLEGKAQLGMLADTLTTSEGTYYEMSTKELTTVLGETKTSSDRTLYLINPLIDITPAPEMDKPDELEIELPTGKLGLVVKGKFPPKISKLRKKSPLKHLVPPGMAIESLTVGDDVYKHMAATEVAGFLKGTDKIEGRILKLKNPDSPNVSFETLPDSMDVPLPPGKMGIRFKGNPPVATRTNAGSPLVGAIPMGMFADSITMGDGTVISGFNAKKLQKILMNTTTDPDRVLTMKNNKTNKPTGEGTAIPDEKTIDLPDGKLGISFIGKSRAKISRIHDKSQVAGMVQIGMVCDSIILDDGRVFSGLTAKEAARVLSDTSVEMLGRKMVLKNPKTAEMTARNVVVDEVDGSIMISTADAPKSVHG